MFLGSLPVGGFPTERDGMLVRLSPLGLGQEHFVTGGVMYAIFWLGNPFRVVVLMGQ